MLEDQLAAITGLWATPEGATFNYEGKTLSIKESPGLPKPAQQPGPPIIIGGRGPKRTPRLAAKYASEFNVPFASVDDFSNACHVVREACHAVGRDPQSLVYSAALVPVSVTAPAPNTRLAFPLLVTVTVCWADVWPTRVAGIVGAGAENPGPSMEKVFESFDALWLASPTKEAEAPAVLEPLAVLLL